MRPITLEFQAFGSYPGTQTIDFDVLGRRGLFLVTGPTGSGKTTVFDAMVYALYGRLPGARSVGNKALEVRSHFASAGVETSVKFTFEVDGTRYTVHRSPAQQRPKLRGSGTTEAPASATVVRHTPTGDQPLASKSDDASKVCADILGIDAGQFQRVVLLPQGKFTDFLVAGDDDREKLLRPLFGTDLYRRATELLNDDMKRLHQEVQSVQAAVAHHRANAQSELATAGRLLLDEGFGEVSPDTDDEQVRSMIADLEPELARRTAEVEALQRALQTAVEERTVAQGAAQRFVDAARHSSTLERLEASRDAVHEGRRRAAASTAARPVVTAHRAVQSATDRVAVAAAERDRAEVVVRDGFQRLGAAAPEFAPATVGAAVEAAGTRVENDRTLLRAAAEAEGKASASEEASASAGATLAAATASLVDLNRRVDEVQALVTSLQPTAVRLEVLEGELRGAESSRTAHHELASATAELVDAITAEAATRVALDEVMRRFVATQAPLLAEQLQAGEPCAVCGSTEHPSPAQHLDGKVTDHKEVEKAQRLQSDAGAAVARLGGVVEGLRQQLGTDADHASTHFDDLVDRARTARDVAADAVRALAAAQAEQQSLHLEVAAARAEVDDARTKVDTLSGTARALRDEADRLAKAAASLDRSAVEARAAVVDELSDVAATLAGLFGECAGAEGALGTAQSALDTALVASGIASVAEAAAAMLSVDDERRLTAESDAWATAYTEASAALATLQTQGVPPTCPDVPALEHAEAEARSAAIAASAVRTTAANALTAAGRALDDACAVAAGSAELQRRYELARTVYRTCNGEGSLKVKMERWVLSAELGRVTDAANVHLARMTNHRYTLRRDEAKGGLGLVVSDSHTGKERATASLSGGEQFQASLSLALGLADVVSMGGTGTGRTFEALFVDEGFGSLDPEALDQAIDALGHLHATGRMVGAITHVEAMKQSLHVGIEVHRLPDGGSTLVVRP